MRGGLTPLGPPSHDPDAPRGTRPEPGPATGRATPGRAPVIGPGVRSETSHHRFMSPTDEACRACRLQMRAPFRALPHAKLMVVSATPVVEAFGGGVETRYVCLDCGHTVMHSTGRFGQGWH